MKKLNPLINYTLLSLLIILNLNCLLFAIQHEQNLQTLIDNTNSGDTLFLKNGIYEATPKSIIEKICGNCVEPLTDVQATVGFYIKGKSIKIYGENPDSTILITNAGYGILFENSYDSYISNLTVTGGIRDPDGNATDAGIVVKNSRVTIENVHIVNNTHRIDTVVVGIGGVFGREGGELFILNNIIRNNGWDGVALYRGATAVIADNIIETGRGAGIGITWDAGAIVYRNRISGYWKGIGTFGESRAVVRNNAVFNNLGWGIIATGNAYMEVLNNVIYHNGNCGFAVWRESTRGILKNNIIAKNGWKDEWVCPCVGVWMNTSLENFSIEYNNVWDNSAGNYEGIDDQTDKNGNISQNPQFINSNSFRLNPESPCINSGDPIIIDSNGTRSDIGIYGGPLGNTRCQMPDS
ncbi:MAG: right-handed parallel beta-helix repeat-containing protein [Candidatus Cloacimonetes bacterium]|nr:right-handed parallel beta-helix repeat-containing protein [Candidatus Cloacimonadota bacterium]